MSGAGFVFWGLFAVCGLIVAAYVVWMLWAERREARSDGPGGG